MDLAHLLKLVSARPRPLRESQGKSLASSRQQPGRSSQQSFAGERHQPLEIPTQRWLTPPLI
ncbi:hypothetical protein [Pseudomonas benzenivorans]|uniref:Uncharacterized protein n=1 Tax=Pseudomonas benzenivorans TaxID=556533 RepID=A0ABY5H8B0_9PSED|nr:hypothetical protein [Pseudomonas benzenivorans]UTW08562.1 hypothetical protein KDW96_04335 [Pseudomonas benzenivorans]